MSILSPESFIFKNSLSRVLNVQIFITIVHILACIVLILVILLQAGKGANMGAAFGGASQTVFGSSGPAGFLGKMTTAVAILFMFTCLSLSYTSLHKGKSVIDAASKPGVERPVVPVQPQKQAIPPVAGTTVPTATQPAPTATQPAK
jgi:preprotein translocase subunit SecG